MQDRRLQIYLEDHLALVIGELALVRRCWGSNRATRLADCLSRLEREIETQADATRAARRRLGGGWLLESRMKQSAVWLAEKFGRLKLNDSLFRYSPLSRVLELESLTAAAEARQAMWETLDEIVRRDGRFEGLTASVYRDQAVRHQRELAEERRLAALEAFTS